MVGRHSAVVVPCLPLPSTPPPSTISPTPPHQYSLQSGSGRQQSKLNTVPASPSCPTPLEEKDELQDLERVPQPAPVSIKEAAEPDWKLHLRPAGSERSESPTSTISHGSLSDFSRPPSSLFSRSTDLASGRTSVLSGDCGDGVSISRSLLCMYFKDATNDCFHHHLLLCRD